MEKLDDILFYSLEKALKRYRQYAQGRLDKTGFDISIDQWIVLRKIAEQPDATQADIAEAAFKDTASVTRIIEILVKKDYLDRTVHEVDRRRFHLRITRKGEELLDEIVPVILSNRGKALEGLAQEDIARMRTLLDLIAANCAKA